MERFSDLLRRALKARRATQRELSRKIGVSQSYVSDVMLGRRDPFTPDRVQATIEALRLSREDGDALAAAAAAERLASYSPKEMMAIVVDRLGAAETRKLLATVVRERAR